MFVTSGLIFLGVIAYALLTHLAVTAIEGGWDSDARALAAIFWPVILAAWLVWRLLLRPWSWAFRLVGDLGRAIHRRLYEGEVADAR